MESGTLRDSGNGLESRLKVRWNENSKVYTRRSNKKAQKTSINNDSATATATGNPVASTTYTTKSPPAADVSVSSSTATKVPLSTAAEVPLSTVATAKSTTKSDAATCRAVIPSSPATTTDNYKNNENAVKEFSGTSGGEVISTPQRLKEKDPDPEQKYSQFLWSKNDDISQRQQEQLPHQEHISDDGVQEGIPTAEPQNLKELSLSTNGNDIHNLKDRSPQVSTNELPQGSGYGKGIVRASSPQASVNQLPNGKGASVAQTSSRCELQNCGEPTTVPSPLLSLTEPVNVNGNVKPLVARIDDRVRFNLSESTSRDEIIELKKRLETELERVKMLFKQLEAKDANVNSNIISSDNVLTAKFGGNLDGYIQPEPQPQPQYGRNDSVEKRVVVRLNAEVGSTGHVVSRPMGLARVNSDVGTMRSMEPRPYNRQLSVAVMENNRTGGEFAEKEKRTPKANQYYRNSEFLLGKDRLPPESNKRGKTNNKRKFGRHGFGYGFPMDKNSNQVFRSCSNLLQRLMKHKHGWVFNEPVNAKALGLHDYHDIIKHPMDLGTIKNRLSQNWYKSPGEFAEDVRLVFQNAMTYNPKGQDVHLMAEQLSEIFEERWAVIEAEYNHYWKYQMYHDAGLPTPTSRKAPSQPHFAPRLHFTPPPVTAPFPAHAPSAPQMMALDRSETVAAPASLDPKFQHTHIGRMPVPKKPKAKDPHKRDMTYEEKQRLSKNLQNLPPEKLDAIVQIIKKRNTALSQNDDEIEVDIDTVDAETLWELDRFVTNFKKSLSKYKRKAELALQASAEANSTVRAVGTSPGLAEVPIESGPGGGKSPAPPPAQGGKQGNNASRSSSSSSSSSDSGSSSSDSDSDSSSADGSDGGH